jgi:DME family drug/metabolite transporter
VGRASTDPGAARRGLLLILLAATLWGTLGVATRALYAVSETSAIEISFIRLVVATPTLLLCCWLVLGRETLRVRRSELGLIAFSGLAVAGSQVAFAAAVGETGVAVATLVTLCVAPVLVAICSVVLLGEQSNRRVVLALVSALVGTALLVVAQADEMGPAQATLAGVLLAVCAAVSYALATLSQRSLVGRYHPLQLITISSACGALALALPLLVNGAQLSYSPTGWALLLYLALFPTVLSYVLFLYGMRYTSATVATIITLQEAVVASILAWLIFGEQLSPLGLLGAALLFAAIGLLYRVGSRQ